MKPEKHHSARLLPRLQLGTAAAALLLALGTTARAAPLPLKICEIDDRSGAAADTGIEGLNGFLLYVDAVNAKGGINGRKIDIITYDGKTDPQLTASFATRCAEDDKGLMIVGGNPTAPAAAMVPVAAQNQIPFYMESASADNLIDANSRWQFRFGPKNSQDAIAISDSFAQLGFKKVAIINVAVPFGIDGAKSITAALEKKGIQVVTTQTYDISATDVSPQVINVRAANPDVILIYPYPADGARVMRTVRQLGLKAPVVVPRVGLIATFRKLAAAAADGVLVPTTVDVSRPDVQKFQADYAAKYKPIQPSPYAVQGYDSAVLMVNVLSDPAVQKAIDGGDLAVARTAIRDATERLGHFQGLQGQAGVGYQFSATEHHGAPDLGFFVFTQVAGNGEQLVAPDLSKIKK